jgi:thiol-disulfide isomerase/thioredoxin
MVIEMGRAMRRFAALLAVGLGGASVLRAQDDLGLPLGTAVQPVVIEDLEGRPVDLGELIGKRPVLLEFWATWCPLCRALEPKLAAAERRYGDRVAFVAVAVAVNQNKASIKRHLERHPLPLKVLWDTNGNAVRAFQAPGTSYVVILDATGRVRYTGAGEDQDLEAALAKVMESSPPR